MLLSACLKVFCTYRPPTTSEKVRLYSILMEDVRELKEFAVKHCRVVSFSGGGQYFSFANNAQVRTALRASPTHV